MSLESLYHHSGYAWILDLIKPWQDEVEHRLESYLSLLTQEWYGNPSTIWYPSIEPKIRGVERFLSSDPEDLMKSGQINDVPLIIGVTRDEFSFRVSSEYASIKFSC